MNVRARWSVYLDSDCPSCGQDVNLLDHPEFWDGRQLDLCENGTERSKNVKVCCPRCSEEFTVDLEL